MIYAFSYQNEDSRALYMLRSNRVNNNVIWLSEVLSRA